MSTTPIQIAIAEDQILLRKAMVELLEMEEDIRIVYEANNGVELLKYLKHGKATLVLTDLEMPEMGGMELITQLKELRPELPVMVLSSHEEEEIILRSIQTGAKGYLMKNSRPDEVVRAIRSILKNGFYFKENISKLLLRGIVDHKLIQTRTEKNRLTPREVEVLKLICQEMTNKEIAEKLNLSSRTVESYRKNMIEKIGARNTAGLVIYALKNGIFKI
jgi:DNA-binding NarL/FixJ family response regulator